jgi:hypothetical protein
MESESYTQAQLDFRRGGWAQAPAGASEARRARTDAARAPDGDGLPEGERDPAVLADALS